MGIFQTMIELGASALEHVRLGLPTVDDETQRTRMEICYICPFYSKRDTCAKCSCNMKFKTSWPEVSCPVTNKHLDKHEHSLAYPDEEFVPKWPAVAIDNSASPSE